MLVNHLEPQLGLRRVPSQSWVEGLDRERRRSSSSTSSTYLRSEAIAVSDGASRTVPATEAATAPRFALDPYLCQLFPLQHPPSIATQCSDRARMAAISISPGFRTSPRLATPTLTRAASSGEPASLKAQPDSCSAVMRATTYRLFARFFCTLRSKVIASFLSVAKKTELHS